MVDVDFDILDEKAGAFDEEADREVMDRSRLHLTARSYRVGVDESLILKRALYDDGILASRVRGDAD
jgi:hypothetical protein